MANLKYRYLIVVLLLAVTASVVNGLQYSSEIDDSEAADLLPIPLQIAEFWQGQDFPLEEMVYEILETRAIIHRSYTRNNGENVFLSIVHYSDTKVDFHAPEACLGGRGLKTEKTDKTISFQSGDEQIALDVAEIMTTTSTGKTLTYYFYKSGDFVGSNYIKMRLSIAANKLFENDARGSLVRISTNFEPGKKAEAESLLAGFLQDLYPNIIQSL
jgi:EpsI family protein